MSVPCERNPDLHSRVLEYTEVLRTQAHTLGDHGLSEQEFYNSGLFRGAIERLRGQFSAAMRTKREFVQHVLNYLQDEGHITDWYSAGGANRHDYSVTLPNDRVTAIELKGCLDGNNTNIYERPPHANEFIIWSICTNPTADPQHNVWSGLHTRLSAEIISRQQPVDGVVVWDMICGTFGRPCPKLVQDDRITEIAQYRLPPPCIFLFPSTVPSPRNNPNPRAQNLQDVGFLDQLSQAFNCRSDEIAYVDFEVAHQDADTVRTTIIRRGHQVIRQSEPTPIRRS